MSRITPHPARSLARWLAAIVLAVLVAHPRAAAAQGFPGGMSGGMGGRGGSRGARGERGNRGDQSTDSARVARRENAGTLADIALRHRTELQLTDSQATALGVIAERARTDRITAAASLAALRDTAPEVGATTPPNDSTRKAILQRRRALAAAIAQLHDVDVDARTATLAILSPAQQTSLEKLDSADGASGDARGSEGGGYGRGRGGAQGP